MSNGSKLFAISFFRKIEDHEKKSTGNATRRKMQSHLLAAWWVSSPPRAQSCTLRNRPNRKSWTLKDLHVYALVHHYLVETVTYIIS
jgi:hypothetical protein